MNKQEHIVAVVDSTHEEDSTLNLARQVVDRGGRATVVVLVNGTTTSDIRRFAEAENLTVPDARAIYLERLSRMYSSRVGGLNTSAIVAERDYSGRSVFASAEKAEPDDHRRVAQPGQPAQLAWPGGPLAGPGLDRPKKGCMSLTETRQHIVSRR